MKTHLKGVLVRAPFFLSPFGAQVESFSMPQDGEAVFDLTFRSINDLVVFMDNLNGRKSMADFQQTEIVQSQRAVVLRPCR